MVKAIQELKTENDELKDKLAKFEQVQNMLVKKMEALELKDNDVKAVNLDEKK
jgi:FtsZ-binding cell division protein ZapB